MASPVSSSPNTGPRSNSSAFCWVVKTMFCPCPTSSRRALHLVRQGLPKQQYTQYQSRNHPKRSRQSFPQQPQPQRPQQRNELGQIRQIRPRQSLHLLQIRPNSSPAQVSTVRPRAVGNSSCNKATGKSTNSHREWPANWLSIAANSQAATNTASRATWRQKHLLAAKGFQLAVAPIRKNTNSTATAANEY